MYSWRIANSVYGSYGFLRVPTEYRVNNNPRVIITLRYFPFRYFTCKSNSLVLVRAVEDAVLVAEGAHAP